MGSVNRMDNRKVIYLDDALEAIRKLPNAGIHWFVSAEAVFNALLKLPSAQPERKNESVGCNGCRYDWFGDPRCNRCARSFQDRYEAEMRGEQNE